VTLKITGFWLVLFVTDQCPNSYPLSGIPSHLARELKGRVIDSPSAKTVSLHFTIPAFDGLMSTKIFVIILSVFPSIVIIPLDLGLVTYVKFVVGSTVILLAMSGKVTFKGTLMNALLTPDPIIAGSSEIL